MAARRRASPAVGSGSVAMLVGFGSGRDQALAFLRRQRLVLGPLLAQVAAALLRYLGHALVVLARLAPLLGGELHPALHAALHARLLFGVHARVALGDADPLQAPVAVEPV